MRRSRASLAAPGTFLRALNFSETGKDLTQKQIRFHISAKQLRSEV